MQENDISCMRRSHARANLLLSCFLRVGGCNSPSEARRLHLCFPRGRVFAEAASEQLLRAQKRKPNCTMTDLNVVAASEPISQALLAEAYIMMQSSTKGTTLL